jgi:hypothetical protein
VILLGMKLNGKLGCTLKESLSGWHCEKGD